MRGASIMMKTLGKFRSWAFRLDVRRIGWIQIILGAITLLILLILALPVSTETYEVVGRPLVARLTGFEPFEDFVLTVNRTAEVWSEVVEIQKEQNLTPNGVILGHVVSNLLMQASIVKLVFFISSILMWILFLLALVLILQGLANLKR